MSLCNNLQYRCMFSYMQRSFFFFDWTLRKNRECDICSESSWPFLVRHKLWGSEFCRKRDCIIGISFYNFSVHYFTLLLSTKAIVSSYILLILTIHEAALSKHRCWSYNFKRNVNYKKMKTVLITTFLGRATTEFHCTSDSMTPRLKIGQRSPLKNCTTLSNEFCDVFTKSNELSFLLESWAEELEVILK